MSKKKQLTGKATKLAKLPLTRVLSKKMEDAGDQPWDPAPVAVSAGESPDPQLPFSWEDLAEGAAGLLTAAYVLIHREVAALYDLVHGQPGAADPEPAEVPPLPQIKQALRLTKTELQELSRLFSA
jgi:hypothetical protein